MPPLSKSFYDPIADILGNVCFQSLVSFTPNELKNCYDMDMIRQYTPLSGSAEISLQNPSDEIQTHHERFENWKTSPATQGQEMEWIVSKCRGITQVYLDPIDIYMEKFFMERPQYIFSSLVVVQIDQFSCKGYQDRDPYHISLPDLHLSLVKISKRAQVSDPIFDWLYWISHID
jgi:hypothetical protein